MKTVKLNRVVHRTKSICPVCMRQLPAKIVFDGRDYHLRKICPEHGKMSAVIWRGTNPDMLS